MTAIISNIKGGVIEIKTYQSQAFLMKLNH